MTSGRCLLWIWFRPSDGDELALLCVIQRFVCLLCLHFNRGHPGESPCLSLCQFGSQKRSLCPENFLAGAAACPVLLLILCLLYRVPELWNYRYKSYRLFLSRPLLSLSLPWATAVFASHYCCFLGTAFPPSLGHSFHVWSERIKAMSRENYGVSLQCVFCCPKLLSPTELVPPHPTIPPIPLPLFFSVC